jgi:hypothetical protein
VGTGAGVREQTADHGLLDLNWSATADGAPAQAELANESRFCRGPASQDVQRKSEAPFVPALTLTSTCRSVAGVDLAAAKPGEGGLCAQGLFAPRRWSQRV